MQSISAFLDITKCADFQSKNADVSRTQGVCHVIDYFFIPLYVKYNCAKFYHRICGTHFRERGLFPHHPRPPLPPRSSLSSPKNTHPE